MIGRGGGVLSVLGVHWVLGALQVLRVRGGR
jgi:hypothetical protein